MAGNDGLVIADSTPVAIGRITWLRFLPDGSREWYEKVEDDFNLVKTEAAPALADHTHPNKPDSTPPSGMCKITNFYWNPETEKMVVEYEDTPVE